MIFWLVSLSSKIEDTSICTRDGGFFPPHNSAALCTFCISHFLMLSGAFFLFVIHAKKPYVAADFTSANYDVLSPSKPVVPNFFTIRTHLKKCVTFPAALASVAITVIGLPCSPPPHTQVAFCLSLDAHSMPRENPQFVNRCSNHIRNLLLVSHSGLEGKHKQ